MVPRKRILFVDDQKDTCEVMKLILEEDGYEVQTTNTWEQTLALARDENFDLYILDLKFPDGLGLELCRKIRKFDTETPVVFYSAHSVQMTPQMVTAVGAQASISKTAYFESLKEVIAQLLNKVENPAKHS